MSTIHFKSVRIFAINHVDWDLAAHEPNKRGKQQVKDLARALKARNFQLLYLCTKPCEVSRLTAWEILEKMGRARAKVTTGEFLELKRVTDMPLLSGETVSTALTSDRVRNGKQLMSQGLKKIAQTVAFKCLDLRTKEVEVERQDVLSVLDNRWLELASLEPDHTPFGLSGGQGLVYTVQTIWESAPDKLEERTNVRSTIVDCEPICW